MTQDEKIAAALAAMAHPVRVGIMRLLAQAGPEGLAAGGLATKLVISASAMSFHLSRLAQVKLVHATRHGQSVIYRAEFDALIQLLDHLAGACCLDSTSSCGPNCPSLSAAQSAGRPASVHRRSNS